jgi:hypothetical protein
MVDVGEPDRLRDLFGADAEVIRWLAQGGWWFSAAAIERWRNGRGDHARTLAVAVELELAWLRARVSAGERFGAQGTLVPPREPGAA